MSKPKLTTQIAILKGKRENLFRKLQILYDRSQDLSTESKLKEFEVRFSSLDQLKEKFETVMEDWNVANLESNEEFNISFQELIAFDDIYYKIKEVANRVFSSTAVKTCEGGHNPAPDARPRLPKIDLVEFDGDPLKWPLFFETFKTLIHNNSNIDSVSKIHYLLGKLKGQALSVSAGILPSADNYPVLWKALIDKYEDKRALASLYLTQILDFKPLAEESVQGFQQFLEKIDVAVNSLYQLELNDLGDFILTTVCLNKLDVPTRLLFERSLTKNEFPTFAKLSEFIKEQTKILTRTRSLGISKGGIRAIKTPLVHSLVVEQREGTSLGEKTCFLCKSPSHFLHKCDQFLKLSQEERNKFVVQHTLCFNCLKSGHLLNRCSSFFRCTVCGKKHHSLLHEEEKKTKSDTPVTLVSTNHTRPVSYTVALATAVVFAKSKTGGYLRMRLLIDSASQCNFITKEFCEKLGINIRGTSTSVSGIGSMVRRVNGQVSLRFVSRFDETMEFDLDALVIEQITDPLPTRQIDDFLSQKLRKYNLADDSFAVPGPIDGMIGAEFLPSLLNGRKVLEPGLPALIDSPLGLIVMGKLKAKQVREKVLTPHMLSYCCVESDCLGNLLQKFWEMENMSDVQPNNIEDETCERLFTSMVKRNSEGRYEVGLPFVMYPPKLGSSYEIALRRLLLLEKRFERDPKFKQNYISVMQDYIDQGHMLRNPSSDISGYFIPHHGVIKLSSSSTPLRVVFDASSRTSNGKSLNDVLFTGAKLQNDIFDILLLFRLFRVAMTADVRQMYRQIRMTPEHRNYQRILWRSSRDEPVSCYELTTVTFGIKPSPFLALRTLKQLAVDEMNNFPRAAERLQREIYMDDVVSSVPEESEAVELYQQWTGLFKAGGFDLVKWASNSPKLLENIPRQVCRDDAVEFSDEFLKVLGLQWNPREDLFIFSVQPKENAFTKRGILSTVARIWDPLGLLTPVTLCAKLLIKELWELHCDWDEDLPQAIRQQWQVFQKDLSLLRAFQIPRHIGMNRQKQQVLVGFADASEKAYAAVLYMWVGTKEGVGKASLLCAKSKVAPQKTISVPRLELCAALLLARLMKRVFHTYAPSCPVDRFLAFSDSTVTLHWIKSSPHRWKTFVATRVTQIQEIIPPDNWFHVMGNENPADIASRGLPPRDFCDNQKWKIGPSWLSHLQNWPLENIDTSEIVEEEAEIKPRCLLTKIDPHPIIVLVSRCGSWIKLLRTTVYILRFLRVLPRDLEIKASDLEKAEEMLIKAIQSIHFRREIDLLTTNEELAKPLRVLRPFLHQGLLRVGGRLSNASLSYDQQHPLLLPGRDRFCELLVDHTHKMNMHAGPTLMLALLRQKYWLLGARNLIRQRYRQCNRCFRCKPTGSVPLMADLPPPRVTEAKPFLHTGTDFAGPFTISMTRHRGVRTQKSYLCLFVCLATRAVHLECASDLTTDCFLAALKRFLARRGACSTLYSDQGTNFLGAKRQLDELQNFLESEPFRGQFQDTLAIRKITWKFNPPAAPNFGGLWEAGVKSVKYHLTRVIGDQVLTYEEFSTVLCQVEAILNSRPMCWLSSDPAEPLALTPAHFLTLTPLQSLPAANVEEVPSNRLRRKELLDKIVQSYWKRWRTEYLSGLQLRLKWNTPTRPAVPGTLVVINVDNLPPLNWPLGIIREVYPGKDGIVRVALVKTKDSLLQRPVSKLIPLPSQ